MTNILLNFSLIAKLCIFILLPIVLVVLVGLVMLNRYSKNANRKNIEYYNYSMEYYASLIAMIIVGILLAIVSGFSISFTQTMRIKSIIVGNEAIYYFLMLVPLVPLTFLLYYIRKFIVAAEGKREALSTAKDA